MKIKSFFSNKHNRNGFVAIGFIMLFLFVILLSPTFAQLTPVKSVTIESENLSYTDDVQGAWKITKSAKWVSKGKARITLDVESIVKAHNEYTDVILVLDTSGSMNGERLDKVKSDTINLINEIVPEGNNVALITFSDDSEIITDFTNDSETLINYINALEAVGNTNYYQALVNVDSVLKNYEVKEKRDCVVLFLTDGYPNIDSPNETGQYEYLKSTYPYLTINGIQYEMGEEILEPLQTITDNQYIAYVEDLEQFLYRAAVNPVEYKNFEIIDYIEDEYFNVDDISSIEVSTGSVNLDANKVTWNLDKIKTGSTQQMMIDINLNEELIGVGGVYPTNEQIEVNSLMENTSEEVMSTLTPILADNYLVVYDGNAPEDCTVLGVPESTNISVFDTVSISSDEPSCEGYQFKGWELVSENVKQVNSEYFIMPEENVTLRATWAKLALDKAMDGKISQVQNLYQMMADNSVPDNIASEFVTSSTGINFGKKSSQTNGQGIYLDADTLEYEYPIYYYRGDVDNNNLIFANFCWKIVRTTETGGVKLIYNGVPNEDGSCTATGEDATIGSNMFNSSSNSIAYAGYMYGDVYGVGLIKNDIVGLGGIKEYSVVNSSSTNYIYSSSVTYGELEDGTYGYTLIDGENRIWNDTYSVDTGNQFLYTCLSETNSTCSEVHFITQSANASTIYYVTFTEGTTAEEILSKEIVYGNDVSYNEENGMYTLQTTMASKIGNLKVDVDVIGGDNGYRYTCFNENGVCETVSYIIGIHEKTRSYGFYFYTNFSSGIKVEEAVRKMTTESEYTTSSTVKTIIDTWYQNNLIDYTEKLEDTIWCNDRAVGTYGSWDKDGNASAALEYQTKMDLDNNEIKLGCRNINNAYTVNDTVNGNGALTYPVGLPTIDEIIYAGARGSNGNYYLYIGTGFWTLSPYYSSNNSYNFYIQSYGGAGFTSSSFESGIRPSISLKVGTRSIDGDGSPEDPFIVEDDNSVTITFTVDGVTYYATEGMTWFEWITSAYNAGGITTSSTGEESVYGTNGYPIAGVYGNDVIVAEERYSTK